MFLYLFYKLETYKNWILFHVIKLPYEILRPVKLANFLILATTNLYVFILIHIQNLKVIESSYQVHYSIRTCVIVRASHQNTGSRGKISFFIRFKNVKYIRNSIWIVWPSPMVYGTVFKKKLILKDHYFNTNDNHFHRNAIIAEKKLNIFSNFIFFAITFEESWIFFERISDQNNSGN